MRNLKEWLEKRKAGTYALVAFTVAGVANILEWYAGYTSLAAGVFAWWVGVHRNPLMQAMPKIRLPGIQHARGFDWFSREMARSDRVAKIGRAVERLSPQREESAQIWEGFSLAISKATGDVVFIEVQLYGTNESVGHYSYVL